MGEEVVAEDGDRAAIARAATGLEPTLTMEV